MPYTDPHRVDPTKPDEAKAYKVQYERGHAINEVEVPADHFEPVGYGVVFWAVNEDGDDERVAYFPCVLGVTQVTAE